jgi:malonate transporter
MDEIAGIALPFFGLIALGYGLGRWRKVPADGLSWINLFVFYLALPAWFFQLVAEAGIPGAIPWSFVTITVFGTYCTFAIAFSIAALANRGNVPISTIQGLVGSCANSGYMGPGLTIVAIGSAAAVPTALIFSVETAMFCLLVPLMMALGGTERTSLVAVLGKAARSVLLHPFILATVAGFVVAASEVDIPQPVDALLTLLRSAAVPCALFALGVGLTYRRSRGLTADVPALVAIKLLIHPLIVYLLLGWIGRFDEVWVYTAVLLAALPPAANVVVLARKYRVYADEASAAILVGTVASVLTVTAVLWLILSGRLPIDPFH